MWGYQANSTSQVTDSKAESTLRSAESVLPYLRLQQVACSRGNQGNGEDTVQSALQASLVVWQVRQVILILLQHATQHSCCPVVLPCHSSAAYWVRSNDDLAVILPVVLKFGGCQISINMR